APGVGGCQYGRGEPGSPRLREGHLRPPPGHYLAEASTAIETSRHRRLRQHGNGRLRIDAARPHAFGVLGDTDHAVGVVPAQVGEDEETRDPGGVGGGGTQSFEDAGGQALEAPGVDGWHVRYNTAW